MHWGEMGMRKGKSGLGMSERCSGCCHHEVVGVPQLFRLLILSRKILKLTEEGPFYIQRLCGLISQKQRRKKTRIVWK